MVNYRINAVRLKLVENGGDDFEATDANSIPDSDSTRSFLFRIRECMHYLQTILSASEGRKEATTKMIGY